LKKKYLLGVDLGGSKILTLLLDPKFRVLSEHKEKMDVAKGFSYFLNCLREGVSTVLLKAKIKQEQVSALGVGSAGLIHPTEGRILCSPNIPFLKNCLLKEKLQSAFKIPVVLENDVNAGLYGEFQLGAARGFSHVAGIFLGTGVGGALILDGKLYRGAFGGAGEIGHTWIHASENPENFRGTVEGLAGRLAIASEASLLLLRHQSPALFKKVGYDVRKIKSNVLTEAIREGDKRLEALMLQKAKVIGIAMANCVNLLNPEAIVLGGGLVEAMGHWIVPAARATMKQYALKPLAEKVKVIPAHLGDRAVAMGAALLAFNHVSRRVS
jgi:glucokinase